MGSTYTNLLYHVVFATKERRNLINDKLRDDLYEFIGGIIRQERGVLLEIGGMPDHLHLVARLQPDRALATVMRAVKAKSSRWANQQDLVRSRFRWQRGYSAFSVSESQLKTVTAYIKRQPEHHKRMSFLEEFRELLKRHGVSFDEPSLSQ